MITDVKPKDFNPKFTGVGIFLEHDGKILLLKRHENKPEGNTWTGPGGKVDLGETPKSAIIRETFEETGVQINPKKLITIQTSYVRFPQYDFTWVIFRYILDSKPEIKLHNAEHTAHQWLTPEDALKENLMQDEDYCIKKTYNLE